MKLQLFLCLWLSFFCFQSYSQSQINASGKVTDEENQSLLGVDILVKGTSRGAITKEDGTFSLTVNSGDVLVFSFVGFESKEIAIQNNSYLNITLKEGVDLEEIVVIGSRNKNRTSLETAVPVDVLDIRELSLKSAQVNVNQLLNYIAPSFTSQPQIVSDGTDHIDPASLRGLGPDQVLVLINGKRRHTTALVNVNGTPGRGSVGTDLNAIPVASIERIEILRDGASAQYGSDAIAGVINVVLKKNTNNLNISLHSGANFSQNGNNFDGGMDGEEMQFNINRGLALGTKGGFINLTGSLNSRNRNSRSKAFTGEIFNGYNSIEWVANQSGYNISDLQNNLTAIQLYAQDVPHFSTNLKDQINAATDLQTVRNLLSDADGNPVDYSDEELIARNMERGDFRMNIGQPELRGGSLSMNMELPLDKSTFYSFGGISHRKSVGFAFYRRPTQQRTYTPLNINGHRPEGRGDVRDRSLSVGIKQDIGNWHTDLSNTWGVNDYKFVTALSANATLQDASPTTADSWNMSFMQNTSNFDVSRFWKDQWEGLNFATGAEYRVENYSIFESDERSWGIYDVNGTLVDDFNLLADSLKVTDFFGRARPGGIQAFPGFRPSNAVDVFRQNFAIYTDVEVDFTKRFMLAAAVRFEHYSDFGSTINFKLASLFKLIENAALRGSFSTGFRAPSLHQINFSSVSTQFINGIGAQVLTAPNTSTLARNLGISELKQETSTSASLGITAKTPALGLSISVDGFITQINDRVILTDMFTQSSFAENGRDDLAASLIAAGAEKVQFFTNAINTQTSGIEFVISQTSLLANRTLLSHNLGAAFLQTKRIGNISSSPELEGYEDTYFGERSRIFLEESMPRTKFNLSHTLKMAKWNFLLANTYFGSVTDADSYLENDVQIFPEYGGKVVTDLSITYDISKKIQFTLGCDNLLDVYPDAAPFDLTSGNQFVYSRRISQFGTNGRYIFAKFNLSI